MHRTSPPSRFSRLPAAVVGLAVMVPVTLAPQPAVMAEARASALSASSRCEHWTAGIAQAAKRLCGQQVAIVVTMRPNRMAEAPAPVWFASVPIASTTPTESPLLPEQLDLPPPA